LDAKELVTVKIVCPKIVYIAAPELPCLLKHTVLALPKSELALQGDLAAYTIYQFESIKQPKEGPRELESGPFCEHLSEMG